MRISWPSGMAIASWCIALVAVVIWWHHASVAHAGTLRTELQTLSTYARSFVTMVLPWIVIALVCHIFAGFHAMRRRESPPNRRQQAAPHVNALRVLSRQSYPAHWNAACDSDDVIA